MRLRYGHGMPCPYGLAMASPYVRGNGDLMTKDHVRLQRILPAPASEIFPLWTAPAAIKSWLGGNIPLVECDARPGGALRILLQSPEGRTSAYVGVFREVCPPARLVFTWAREEAPCGAKERPDTRESTVTVELRPAEGGTELTLVHDGPPDETVREEYRRFWEGCLERLAQKTGRR